MEAVSETKNPSKGLPLVSGGTDNHLMLVDVTAAGLGGKQAESVLDETAVYLRAEMREHYRLRTSRKRWRGSRS